jgi:hypothetical protein
MVVVKCCYERRDYGPVWIYREKMKYIILIAFVRINKVQIECIVRTNLLAMYYSDILI